MDPGARWTLPPAKPGSNRNLYVVAGGPLTLGGSTFSPKTGVALRPDAEVELVNGDARTELLLLQGRPIGEPVVAHGPFVMCSPQEINEAIREYRHTEFGGWPWPNHGPVHPRDAGRFAKHVGGRVERVA
jgi:redox-sensitive bicupin YhaK (pirin superfamily)